MSWLSSSRAMRHRPSGSRRQTIRKRRRTLGKSGPRALLNQLACPCVAANRPFRASSPGRSPPTSPAAAQPRGARSVPRSPVLPARRRPHPRCRTRPTRWDRRTRTPRQAPLARPDSPYVQRRELQCGPSIIRGVVIRAITTVRASASGDHGAARRRNAERRPARARSLLRARKRNGEAVASPFRSVLRDA